MACPLQSNTWRDGGRVQRCRTREEGQLAAAGFNRSQYDAARRAAGRRPQEKARQNIRHNCARPLGLFKAAKRLTLTG